VTGDAQGDLLLQRRCRTPGKARQESAGGKQQWRERGGSEPPPRR
jgi:hypothetical protein